jgi:hypothetical protein
MMLLLLSFSSGRLHCCLFDNNALGIICTEVFLCFSNAMYCCQDHCQGMSARQSIFFVSYFLLHSQHSRHDQTASLTFSWSQDALLLLCIFPRPFDTLYL